MKKIASILFAAALGAIAPASPAMASPAGEALSLCLADNTTGRDRKDLARWIFLAMSAHPEIRNISNVSQAQRDDINRGMGKIITKLLTERCPAQARSAMEREGSGALQTAFGVVGQLAMQELMSNPEVTASVGEYVKYIDQGRMNSVFNSR